MKKIKTLILTSCENFVWSSMQEIIPHLERCWLKSADSNHQVDLINVDNLDLKSVARLAWSADNVVLTCFNFKLVSIVSFLKNELQLNFRFIFHLHNQATIGLWPLYEFGLLKFFRSSDLFISSCTRDWNTLLITCPNALGATIPFSLSDSEILQMKDCSRQPLKNEFYFAGRISRQKNLHSIFRSLSLLKKQGVQTHFHIYGEEDNLGSPNMGIADSQYLDELVKLSNELGITSMVTFYGKKNRDDLYQIHLKSRLIFISVSAHSDENFGMAAFRALLRGEPALLSDWGGHSDLAANFSPQAKLIDIIHKGHELSVDENVLAETMKEIVLFPHTKTEAEHEYFEETLAGLYKSLATQTVFNGDALQISTQGQALFKRRENVKAHPTKIFENYLDPMALPYFKSYGLKGGT